MVEADLGNYDIKDQGEETLLKTLGLIFTINDAPITETNADTQIMGLKAVVRFMEETKKMVRQLVSSCRAVTVIDPGKTCRSRRRKLVLAKVW